MPHPRPINGNVTAAMPRMPCSNSANASPMGPAASNHTESTASPESTMSPMPRVSRAKGERIWTVGARCGFLLGVGRLAAGRLAGGRFVELFLLLDWVDGRDAERRDGEVFVAIAL